MTTILRDEPAPGVCRLLLNRPEARNAINVEMRTELGEQMRRAIADPGVHAILIAGSGGVFSAGGDLPSMVGISPEAARQRMELLASVTEIIWHSPKPVVTAVERYAVGGCAGLAMLADWAILGEAAFLSFPFLNLGLVPDMGLMATLPARAGLATATRLLLQRAQLTGREALAVNLVEEVVADAKVMERGIAKAVEIGRLPPEAFRRLKARLRPAGSLDQAYEVEAQIGCFLGAEFPEGLAAFREKRTPDFRRA